MGALPVRCNPANRRIRTTVTIPNAFTQRGVLGGDSRSGCMPMSSPVLEFGSLAETCGSSDGGVALAADDGCKGRMSGSVMCVLTTLHTSGRHGECALSSPGVTFVTTLTPRLPYPSFVCLR